jgi:hypothetical protein
VIAYSVEVAVLLWFAASLGIYCSLRSSTSTRAMVSTISALILINSAGLLGCAAFGPYAFIPLATVTPILVSASLVSFEEMNWLFNISNPSFDFGVTAGAITVIVVAVVIYACFAFMLTSDAIREFDDLVDRHPRLIPRLRGKSVTPIVE